MAVLAEGPQGTVTAPVHLRADDALDASGWLVTSFLFVLTPWFCLILGFFVAFLRPRDPLAWLLLALLLSFAAVAQGDRVATLIMMWSGWTRPFATAVNTLCNAGWALWMMLFGQYFPDRKSTRWLDRLSRWVLGVPIVAGALVSTVTTVLDLDDASVWSGLQTSLRRVGWLLLLLTMLAISTFFINIFVKMSNAKGDARRRLKLLYGGATAALTPLFLVVMWSLIFRKPTTGMSGWSFMTRCSSLPAWAGCFISINARAASHKAHALHSG